MIKHKLQTYLPYVSAGLLGLAAVFLLVVMNKPQGWITLGLCALTLLLGKRQFVKEMLLLVLAIALMAVSPVSTSLGTLNIIVMSIGLTAAVVLPYVISRYIYKDRTIQFKFNFKRAWRKKEITYLAVWLLAGYFILPIYFATTGAHTNWTVEPTFDSLARLLYGLIATGVWDEFFFICTVLGILRRHLPFWFANGLQAIIFVSFLLELGFTGWAFIPLYIFALLQGIIFKRTESLLYVLAIHLSIDLVLYLALIHAHHPQLMPIFITG